MLLSYTTISNAVCHIKRFNLLKYKEGLTLQEKLVESRIKGEVTDHLLILEHYPVITFGRGTHKENLLTDYDTLKKSGIEIHESPRGGDITIHLPGQLIVYPILYLAENERNLKKYMRKLEEVIIHTLLDFGIKGERKQKYTGVWVNDKKIAAIGIHCWRWVVSHGFALNINPDLTIFKHIIPCGIKEYGITSMYDELHNYKDLHLKNDMFLHLKENADYHSFRLKVEQGIIKHFAELFQRNIINKEL